MKAAALHWFTSDLRLHDNAALAEAARGGPVTGVFVLNPALLERHAGAPRRIAFMYACLGALDTALRRHASRLVVVEGDPSTALPRLANALGARLVTHARNHEPAARAREARVARALARDGVAVRATEAALVQPPGSLTTAGGGAYQVYGAYARAWEGSDVPAAVRPPRQWTMEDALEGAGISVPAPPPGIELPPAGEDAEPWTLTAMERRMLCPDYPGPLVGLEEGRARALAAFEDARGRAASARSPR